MVNWPRWPIWTVRFMVRAIAIKLLGNLSLKLKHVPGGSNHLAHMAVGDDMLCLAESSFIGALSILSLLCVTFSAIIVGWGCAKLRGAKTSDSLDEAYTSDASATQRPPVTTLIHPGLVGRTNWLWPIKCAYETKLIMEKSSKTEKNDFQTLREVFFASAIEFLLYFTFPQLSFV